MEFYGTWQLLATHYRTPYLRTKLYKISDGKYYGLSYLGTRTIPQGVLFNWKEFEEITFHSKDTFNTVERQLIQNRILCNEGQ